MATDLTKLIDNWQNIDMRNLRQILLAMAKQIKANVIIPRHFICVTNANNRPIRVNIHHIDEILVGIETNGAEIIYAGGNTRLVKESPEEIINLIYRSCPDDS